MYFKESICKISIGLDLNPYHLWIAMINPEINGYVPHHFACKTQSVSRNHTNDMILDNKGKQLGKKIKLTFPQEVNNKLMTITLP